MPGARSHLRDYAAAYALLLAAVVVALLAVAVAHSVCQPWEPSGPAAGDAGCPAGPPLPGR